jgi:hypothetical protein
MLLLLTRLGQAIIDNWRVVAIVGGFILLCILTIATFKACSKPKAKLNEVEIQKAEQAIAERNEAKLKEILVASDVREKAIDANLANAQTEYVNALHESREKYKNMNTDELAAELEERK